MTQSVAFSADAKVDLREIARFSLDRFGAAVASGYVAGLRAACKRLGAFPAMPRSIPWPTRPPAFSSIAATASNTASNPTAS